MNSILSSLLEKISSLLLEVESLLSTLYCSTSIMFLFGSFLHGWERKLIVLAIKPTPMWLIGTLCGCPKRRGYWVLLTWNVSTQHWLSKLLWKAITSQSHSSQLLHSISTQPLSDKLLTLHRIVLSSSIMFLGPRRLFFHNVKWSFSDSKCGREYQILMIEFF